jgi:hypothetical protein
LLASSAEADMLAMMARRSRPQSSTQATPHIHLYPKSWTAKLSGATEVLYGIAGCCARAASGQAAAAPPSSVMNSRPYRGPKLA